MCTEHFNMAHSVFAHNVPAFNQISLDDFNVDEAEGPNSWSNQTGVILWDLGVFVRGCMVHIRVNFHLL